MYKRQEFAYSQAPMEMKGTLMSFWTLTTAVGNLVVARTACLLYTSDAADERSSVDLGGRRIIKKKKQSTNVTTSRRTSKKIRDEQHKDT